MCWRSISRSLERIGNPPRLLDDQEIGEQFPLWRIGAEIISGDGVVEWAVRVSVLAGELGGRFEGQYGYPPGENFLRRSDGSSTGDVRDEMVEHRVASDLVVFYSVVQEVVLSDAGVGWFIESPESVVDRKRSNEMPSRIKTAFEDAVTVFASNGGGDLFALSNSGGPVYRLSGGSLISGVYEMDEGSSAVFCKDLSEFLLIVENEIKNTIDND